MLKTYISILNLRNPTEGTPQKTTSTKPYNHSPQVLVLRVRIRGMHLRMGPFGRVFEASSRSREAGYNIPMLERVVLPGGPQTLGPTSSPIDPFLQCMSHSSLRIWEEDHSSLIYSCRRGPGSDPPATRTRMGWFPKSRRKFSSKSAVSNEAVPAA